MNRRVMGSSDDGERKKYSEILFISDSGFTHRGGFKRGTKIAKEHKTMTPRKITKKSKGEPM